MTKERLEEIRKAVEVLSTISAGEWAELESSCSDKHTGKLQARTMKSQSSNDERVYQLMKELDVPANLKGYRYMKKAILIALDDPGVLEHVTKELYPAVAAYFDTTMSRVERAIRHAIEHVYASEKNAYVLKDIFGHEDRLTNSEFIAGIFVYLDNQE